jgi:hypothetical protein
MNDDRLRRLARKLDDLALDDTLSAADRERRLAVLTRALTAPERERLREHLRRSPANTGLTVLPAAQRLVRSLGWDVDGFPADVLHKYRSLVEGVRRQGGGAGCLVLRLGQTLLIFYVRAPNVRDGGGPPDVFAAMTPEDVAALDPADPAQGFVREEVEAYLRRPGVVPPEPRP